MQIDSRKSSYGLDFLLFLFFIRLMQNNLAELFLFIYVTIYKQAKNLSRLSLWKPLKGK